MKMTHQIKKRGSTSIAFVYDSTNIVFHGVGTLLIEDKDDSIELSFFGYGDRQPRFTKDIVRTSEDSIIIRKDDLK